MAAAGRVIAGTARGVRLMAPGEGTRPLADRVKQALFGALESEAPAGFPSFLDLYAGSGAAGIEALSRGSPAVTFVERDRGAARVIAENLRRAELAGGRVVRRDVLSFLRAGAGATDNCFGACFLDPPYADTRAATLAMDLLGDASRRWLAGNAVVCVKHFWRAEPIAPDGLRLIRTRRFGETALSYYRAVRVSNDPAGEEGVGA